MKSIAKITGVLIVTLMLTSCVAYDNTGYNGNGNRLPPGQAKKIYGGSAKDYAPGQVKKRNGY
ncbi:quinol oxidase subunit 4 [Chryseobacterium lactis]|uniref:Quinol oxidase subunit 4 n=1 Tax=Chryseobacterium lactis TaxID=1241981 RepID=A0A3G6RGN9_CHRLC|nr:quinol oxidase subunit 4 [Chryseobacterium lactis]AZA83816.1 quinol oxidase subunit 4 [Chryseobacterium lactis]AZB04201.1 quinol oxidase subunit 4 [Chryseobacterium lactis]PNW12890.1 quinol oxidase subunit 4 [Chryseobacterium lactis]